MSSSMLDPSARIYVAGHTGLVGSALVRTLHASGYRNLLLRCHHELDLTNQSAVARFFSTESPEYVFLAAAKVGAFTPTTPILLISSHRTSRFRAT